MFCCRSRVKFTLIETPRHTTQKPVSNQTEERVLCCWNEASEKLQINFKNLVHALAHEGVKEDLETVVYFGQ